MKMKVFVSQVMNSKSENDILIEQERAKVVIANKMRMDVDNLDVKFIDSRFVNTIGFSPDTPLVSI